MTSVERREPRNDNYSLAGSHALFAANNVWTTMVPWLIAAVLFLVALRLRLYRLDVQPLWLDEGETWNRVTHAPLRALLIDLFRPTQAYPLYHLVVKVATRLLGDSEWALRLPSAIAGALAVPAIFALGRELRGSVLGLGAALLLLLSPFALWQAQDAKAYSFTLLIAVLLAWTFARALRINGWRQWIMFGVIAVTAPFAHRLLVLGVISCAIAWSAYAFRTRPRIALVVLVAAISVGLGIVGVMTWSLRAQSAGNQYPQIGLINAAWITFNQFAVGQGSGIVRKRWLAPFALLTLIGAARLAIDLARNRHRRGAIVIGALLAVPALLFALLLLRQPLFEARYLTIVFPFWLVLLAWSIPEMPTVGRGRSHLFDRVGQPVLALATLGLIGVSLLVSNWALHLPGKGLFSGAIVKENYRDMIRVLADHVHPDDLVIVHPDSAVALYSYYAPRVSDQPLPAPTTYYWLGRNEDFKRKELERKLVPALQQHARAWLLIAPAHAAVVDPPRSGDELGLIGLAFQYGDLNNRFLCGTPNADKSYDASVGVKLYCNSTPDPIVNGGVPQPAVVQPITFGDQVRFLGYTLTPFASGVRPGGTLPITLYWSPTQSLAGSDYRMFVHLTTADNPKPLAQVDGQPLEGGLPTTLWTRPNDTIHDERTIKLTDIETGEPIPPGQYVLRVGVWNAQNGERLTASGTDQPIYEEGVVIGTVEVQVPSEAQGQ